MNPEVRALFRELADLSPNERQRVIAERRVKPEVLAEIESLLSFDSANVQEIADCVAGAAQQVLVSARGQVLGSCGPYRLVKLLGSGGMGAVYLGERCDGEIQQKVAVKLLRGDANRPSWRDRFLRERQLLASLDHPCIVHVIDAGHTGDGRPYLVMEYVDGTPIDVYSAKIEVRERLALFLQVCAGVSHAHRHLIIHRDLKPSNILVDAAGQPKLLDFGIAKLLDETGDRTETVERLLTPNYSSPEQLSGTVQTTAADVYSLGAVLYKLLTGRSPHEPEAGTAQTAAHSLGALTGAREIPAPSRVNHSLASDLDYILRKALRMEPEERYASVEAFASDIRAFLESKPVQARSGDAWYGARKFLRRYWVPMAAAALVIASLSAGLYVANRQRVIAEHRFGQLHELSKKLLDLETETRIADLKLRAKLISLSIQYLEGLGRDPFHDKALALEISGAYLRIARNQGVPEWNQQGQYLQAEKNLSKAKAFADSVIEEDPDNREALWLVGNVAHDRAVTAAAERNYQQVLDNSPQAVDAFNHLALLGNMTKREINGATYIYGDLAEVHLGLHRFADAERYARLGIEISKNTSTVPGPRGQAFNMLAGALTYLGDFPGALAAIQEARKQFEKLRAVDPNPGYVVLIGVQTRSREGLMLGEDGGVNLNRPFEAVVPLEESFKSLEPFPSKDAGDYQARAELARAGHYLGDVLRHDHPSRALEVYDRSLATIREVPDDVAARRMETLLLAGSSYAARWMQREKDARDRIDAAFRLLRQTKDYPAESITPGGEADTVMRALADHRAETGETAQAVEVYRQLYRKIMASKPDPENDLLNAVYVSRLDASLAMLLRRMGKKDEAAPLEAARLELWRRWSRKLPGNPFVRRQFEAALPQVLPAIHGNSDRTL